MGACPRRQSVPAASAVRTEAVLLQQKPNHAADPVGAPAPGANGACPRRQSVPAASAVRTEAVLLQQNQNRPRTVGAPAPGANGACPGRYVVPASFAVRTRGGAPTAKNQNLPSNL